MKPGKLVQHPEQQHVYHNVHPWRSSCSSNLIIGEDHWRPFWPTFLNLTLPDSSRAAWLLSTWNPMLNRWWLDKWDANGQVGCQLYLETNLMQFEQLCFDCQDPDVGICRGHQSEARRNLKCVRMCFLRSFYFNIFKPFPDMLRRLQYMTTLVKLLWSLCFAWCSFNLGGSFCPHISSVKSTELWSLRRLSRPVTWHGCDHTTPLWSHSQHSHLLTKLVQPLCNTIPNIIHRYP